MYTSQHINCCFLYDNENETEGDIGPEAVVTNKSDVVKDGEFNVYCRKVDLMKVCA